MKNSNRNYYIVAVSGGPDSMALFDMARKAQLKLVCAHVNYHKRETALRDELIVKHYCQKYDIPFYKLDAPEGHGNFQAYARDLRYAFFKEVGKKYHTNKVLVAHQLDDYIETLFIQNGRGSTPFYYGIKSPMCLKGLELIRPLLKYTKADLTHYCEVHAIPYGIDESNLGDHYLRNRYRHHLVVKMTKTQKLQLFNQIESLNAKRTALIEEYRIKYAKNIYSMNEIVAIKDLDLFLRTKLYADLSKPYLNELKRLIKDTKQFNVVIKRHCMCKEYGMLVFYTKPKAYQYVIPKIESIDNDYFKIVKNADSFHSLTLQPSDFPLTIRNYQPGDKIVMNYGTKKLARYFIDHKILNYRRQTWPVVLNAQGEIIFVPKIGCAKSHYSINPNFFMIEL